VFLAQPLLVSLYCISMKIALACDHAGFILKEAVAKYLRDEGHDVRDFGTWSTESVDYPDFLYPAAMAVAKGECERGILVPGIAYAGAIVANKIPGIRGAAVEDLYAVQICRQHGDANVLCLSGQSLGAGLAREIVRTFLTTAFLGGKYAARNQKVSKIESTHLAQQSLTGPSVPTPGKAGTEQGNPPMPENNRASEEIPVLDLITENDVRRAVHSKRPLRAKRKCLITPAARDLIEETGLQVEYV
jgi:ribose 5-phosphate isomerase B